MDCKGFEIRATTDKGLEVIKHNMRTNEKFFDVIKVDESCAHYKLLLKKTAKFFFKPLKDEDFERRLVETMSEHDCMREKDYKLRLIP